VETSYGLSLIQATRNHRDGLVLWQLQPQKESLFFVDLVVAVDLWHVGLDPRPGASMKLLLLYSSFSSCAFLTDTERYA
jgi:hypothetical protein